MNTRLWQKNTTQCCFSNSFTRTPQCHICNDEINSVWNVGFSIGNLNFVVAKILFYSTIHFGRQVEIVKILLLNELAQNRKVWRLDRPISTLIITSTYLFHFPQNDM